VPCWPGNPTLTPDSLYPPLAVQRATKSGARYAELVPARAPYSPYPQEDPDPR